MIVKLSTEMPRKHVLSHDSLAFYTDAKETFVLSPALWTKLTQSSHRLMCWLMKPEANMSHYRPKYPPPGKIVKFLLKFVLDKIMEKHK